MALLDELTNLLACQPNTEDTPSTIRGTPVNSIESVQTQVQNLETGETKALTLDVFSENIPEDEVTQDEFTVVPGYDEKEERNDTDGLKDKTLAEWGATEDQGEIQRSENEEYHRTKSEPATTSGEQSTLNNIPAQ